MASVITLVIAIGFPKCHISELTWADRCDSGSSLHPICLALRDTIQGQEVLMAAVVLVQERMQP